MNNEIIFLKNGKMNISSLDMVEQINFFRREENKPETRHDNLMVIIRDEFEEEISLLELKESDYTNSRGKRYPMFHLTLLQAKQLLARESKHVRKAMLVYIEQMEASLRERQTTDWLQTREKGKLIRREETDAIQRLIPYAKNQGSKNAKMMYMTYSKLVNRTVGVESGKRNVATFMQLHQIIMLEDMISKTILEETARGVYYKEIYKTCKAKANQFAQLLYLTA